MLTSSRRQGTVISSSITPETSTRDYEVEVLLEAADVSNASLQIPISLEASFDGGLNWTPLVSATWVGGMIGRDSNPVQPRLGYKTNRAAGRVRLVLDLPQQLLLSADVVEDDTGGGPRT